MTVRQQGKQTSVAYDRLVFAAGCQLVLPNLSGLHEHAFSVDTYQDAIKLDQHIQKLPELPDVSGKYTAAVVGGGFTGIEAAAEMTSRLTETAKQENKEAEVKVVIIEKEATIGPDLGANPRPIIEQALREMNVEVLTNEAVTAIDAEGVTLTSGKHIPVLTTIWSAGVKASPLAIHLPVEKDNWGRLPVNSYFQVLGLPSVFAAGDTARAKIDDTHFVLMSCQHSMPQGKFAGYNVVCDLFGLDGVPYKQEQYRTCLDLGSWGALATRGWNRVPWAQREEVKKIKMNINQAVIYPPLSGNRDELFEAANLLNM